MMNRFLAWCDRLVEEHKFFRRAALSLAVIVCGWTTYQIFVDIEKISNAAAAAYATATGLLGVTTKWYFEMRDQDDRRGKRQDTRL